MEDTASAPAASAPPVGGPPTADDLRKTVADLVGIAPDEVAGDVNLILLGLTSLGIMRLATGWRRTGLRVEFAALAADPTVDAWERELAAAWQARADKAAAKAAAQAAARTGAQAGEDAR
jgi:aryl carrier-like protein